MSQSPQRGGNIIIGVVLVGLGAMFLLAQVFQVNLLRFLWPFFIIIPGLLFFAGMVAGGKAAAPLAIPGSIVTMTGLILLYQATFNHWQSWAYAWALIIPTAIGIGMMIFGTRSGTPKAVDAGMKMALIGLGVFLVGGFFFEAVIGISRNVPTAWVWPLALIGIGAWLLLRSRRAVPAGPLEAPTRPIVTVEKINPNGGASAAPAPQEPVFEPLDMTRGKK
ncbi:MAG: hypothetical protein IT326_05335 [Anaerolineae bacterium]|nr:hypothetical protein [Anaerolineae bacterium]